eukprot:COSAG06_NODE_1991_length_7895_cov_3.685736_5_plen_134_part_00
MYEHDEVVKHWHEQAHFKVRRKNRPDYYALLGVPKVASEAEIKAAYKRKASNRIHPIKPSAASAPPPDKTINLSTERAGWMPQALIVHPDKHSDSDEATRKTAEVSRICLPFARTCSMQGCLTTPALSLPVPT